MSRIVRFSFFICIAFCLFSCAIQVAPGGGDKDLAPPVIEKMIPENHTTGFKGHDLVIRFDEFIQLKDIQTQLIVSPPLAYQPETKVRKKTLFIHFDDTLREHTTYTFNFGNSIIDNNEGNVLENFQYVFSTGDVIDSLEISGKVDFAFDLKTEKGILVMLYSSPEDSVPYKERPLYFAKTNELGEFHVKNIAPGKYRIFALKTGGTDYQYTNGDESIGFLDTLVEAGQSKVNLHLFSEQREFQITRSYSEFAGKVVVIANGALDTLPFKWITDTSKLAIHALSYSEKRDTLNIWYTNLKADSLQISYTIKEKTDTSTLRLFKFEGKQNLRQPFALTVDPSSSLIQAQDLHLPFSLVFNHPIKNVEYSKIRFMADSQQVEPLRIEFGDSIHRILNFFCNWKEAKSYHLFIPSGSIEDIYGLKNDTILFDTRTHELTDYGTLAVLFSRENASDQYILQLLDAKDNVVRESVLKSDSLVQFLNLLPGSYRMKLIRDENKSGKWDAGNYLKHVQAEEVDFYKEAIMVRANWDVELKWSIGE